MPCEVEGFPTPTIEWTKNGVALSNILNADNYQLLSANQQLKILHTTADQKGNYACLATNKVASAGILFEVDVLLKPAIADDISFDRIIEVLESEGII